MQREDTSGDEAPARIVAGQPFIGLRGAVGAADIDVNGHMNVLGFDRLFDVAESALFLAFGIGGPNIARTGKSVFRLEKTIRYERELFRGDRVEIRSLLLGSDGRRIHHFHELWNLERDQRSACFDGLSIHVDLARRRAAWIEDPAVLAALEAGLSAHAKLPRPRGALDRALIWRD